MGSPPPAGSKNDVFMFRSVNNIVIAPANTGKDNSNKIAVIITDHTNKGIFSNDIPGDFILIVVEMKLIAPKIEEIPAICNEKIVKSTDILLCPVKPAKGGYNVHPVPVPVSTILLIINSISEGGNSQNLILFIRGNAISGAPIMIGSNQLPNPPIIIGITMKKIITKA